jgi:hypothetical protein
VQSESGSQEQSSRGSRWLVVLALSGVVVGVIVYGYLERVGVSGKKFWDYLALLIVPVAIAIGVTVINRMQSKHKDVVGCMERRLTLGRSIPHIGPVGEER